MDLGPETIRFKKGTFKGLKGWYNPRKGPTKKMVYVIVNKDGQQTSARVKKSSIEVIKEPEDYIEATFAQCPDIEVQVDKLVASLAQCTIHDELAEDPDKLVNAIFGRLQKAMQEQLEQGGAGKWRVVKVPADEMTQQV